MLADEEETHLNVCGKFTLPCPNRCSDGKHVRRELLQEHMDEHCSRQKIKCPFWDGGCQYVVGTLIFIILFHIYVVGKGYNVSRSKH